MQILKWAGSKRKQTASIAQMFTDGEPCRGSYWEPFCGSAAVYLHLQKHGLVDRDKATLSDSNFPLMMTYKAIQRDPEAVIRMLEAFPSTWEGARQNYEQIRAIFRDQVEVARNNTGGNPWRVDSLLGEIVRLSEMIAIAGKMLWLNRAGFNGLYRENRAGEYNVPVGAPPSGDWSKPLSLPSPTDIREFNLRIPKHRVFCLRWDTVLQLANNGDWVYLDPPYVPHADMGGGFTQYQAGGFDHEAQVQLAKEAACAVSRGARVVVSNANVPWLREMYEAHGFEVARLDENRAISSRANGRGKTACLVMSAGPRAVRA